MFRTILTYGLIAGAVVAVPMGLMLALAPQQPAATSMFTGYAVMIVALSFIFIGVKRYRDRALGGVIKFLPAFLVGLGISAIAGVVYVIGWEVTLAATDHAFIQDYTARMIEAERAKGVSESELQAFVVQMEEMAAMYANPLFRMPITFIEIFPVGVIISLLTALVLRNSRFLPARGAPAA